MSIETETLLVISIFIFDDIKKSHFMLLENCIPCCHMMVRLRLLIHQNPKYTMHT